jgi:hypothetical protein
VRAWQTQKQYGKQSGRPAELLYIHITNNVQETDVKLTRV